MANRQHLTTMGSVKYRTLLRILYGFYVRLACLSSFSNHGIANQCASRSMLLLFVFVDFVRVSSNSSLRLSNNDVKVFSSFLIYFDMSQFVTSIFRTNFAEV